MAKNRIKPRETVARALAQAMRDSADLQSQAALARRSGVGQTTIGRILRGEVDAQADTLRELAATLRIPVGQLYGELGAAINEAALPVSSIRGGSVSAQKDGAARVPLISWTQMRTLVHNSKEIQDVDVQEWLPAMKDCGPRTFAVRVEGAAMEPRYRHGDVIFVDPDAEAAANRLVVVDTSTEFLFRQLTLEGERRYLRVLNPDWPGPKITPLDANAQICGVVVGALVYS